MKAVDYDIVYGLKLMRHIIQIKIKRNKVICTYLPRPDGITGDLIKVIIN